MDVISVREEVLLVAHAAVSESSLPDGKFGFEATGEAAFDEHQRSLNGDDLWGEEQVNVVRHDDEGMEFVVPFAAVVLEGIEEQLGVGGCLEETAAVPGLGTDEEGSVACCSGRDSHDLTKHTSGAKAR